MPGDWHVRFLGGPGVERRRAYPTDAAVSEGWPDCSNGDGKQWSRGDGLAVWQATR